MYVEIILRKTRIGMLLLLFVEYKIETTILDFINIYTYVNHFLSMATLAEVNILAVRCDIACNPKVDFHILGL